ncbi:MAG TPA: hypothetical protein VM076_21355 [Gemmatimonadaceae bacterium]|nr:hypothetical protein [Gemmatimonadaceae bacterium]
MYTTCLFCNESLGTNDVIELFPVGRRLAFDAERGRLWVICPHCTRWNLSPLEERWEAIDDCERRFRATHLRYSTDNIGLAQLREGLELVRIGKALRPEVAAWRYGDVIQRRGSGRLLGIASGLVRRGVRSANDAIARVTRDDTPSIFADDPLTRLRLIRHRDRVLDVLTDARGNRIVIRWGHLDAAELIRPDPNQPWRLVVKHDQGLTTVTGDDGLRTAAKVLAALNSAGALPDDVRRATAKIEDAEDEQGYFSRIVALAMRTGWGRFPDAQSTGSPIPVTSSAAERLALHITNRSFWGRGSITSEPSTLMLRLPLVDRLALEMAANEDTERRALDGELTELERAWRDAEEVAAIADGMFGSNELEDFRRAHEARQLARATRPGG